MSNYRHGSDISYMNYMVGVLDIFQHIFICIFTPVGGSIARFFTKTNSGSHGTPWWESSCKNPLPVPCYSRAQRVILSDLKTGVHGSCPPCSIYQKSPVYQHPPGSIRKNLSKKLHPGGSLCNFYCKKSLPGGSIDLKILKTIKIVAAYCRIGHIH